MAHNLSFDKNGVAECFQAKTPAWHGKGITTKECLTVGQLLTETNVNHSISKSMLLNPRDGKEMGIYGLFRDDNNFFLNTCSKSYNPLQTVEMFSFLDTLVGKGLAHFETAGVLDGGKSVYCVSRLANLDFAPTEGDNHEARLLCVDHRDGRATTVKTIVTRVVCQNTLSMAMAEAGNVALKFRHSTGRDEKFKMAENLIHLASDSIQAMNTKLRALIQKKVSPIQFKQVFDKLFPDFEKGKQVGTRAGIVANNFMMNDNNQIAGINGTAYSLLQAVTQFIDHQATDFRSEGTIEEQRKTSAMFGKGDKFKNDALKEIESIFLDDIDLMMNEALLTAV